jgi:hypothetical protein
MAQQLPLLIHTGNYTAWKEQAAAAARRKSLQKGRINYSGGKLGADSGSLLNWKF